MMDPHSLREKVQSLPSSPGVYLMKDEKGRVIYVGKAKQLRQRVRSYFQRAGLSDPKTEVMKKHIVDVEILETDSEVDALLLESRLIKEIQPKYNVDLKDDKSYPYLEISDGDDYAGIFYTRDLSNKKSKFYGPFTDARGIQEAIQILQGVFRFRTCRLDIRADDLKKRFYHPCLLYHIEKCSAPCADKISQREYADSIRALKRFLKGDKKGLMGSMRKKMDHAAARLDYEKAGRLRDEIKALESLDKRTNLSLLPQQGVLPVNPAEGLRELDEILKTIDPIRTIEGIDVSNLGGQEAVGALVTFVDGIPFKAGYRRYRIKRVAGVNDYEMIREVVYRRYRRVLEEDMPVPDILLIDGGKGHLAVAARELSKFSVQPGAILALAKEDEVLYVQGRTRPLRLPRASLGLRVLQHVRDESHRFGRVYHHYLRQNSSDAGNNVKVK